MWLVLLVGMLSAESPFLTDSVARLMEKAKAENKLVLVDVYTTWCGPCRLMDRTTFSNEDVREILKNKVIAFKIDAEKGEGIKLARKYKVRGYPCILILDGNGKLVDMQLGYIPPSAFLNWVRRVLT